MFRGGVALGMGLLFLGLPAHAGAATLDANCPGPRELTYSSPGPERFAQTFTAQTSGALTSAEIEITKSGGTGDYVVGIHEVNAGVPTNTVLATATRANATVPDGPQLLAVEFAPPPVLTTGQTYALVITRPASGTVQLGARSGGDDCPGVLYHSPTPTGSFSPLAPVGDMVFNTYVLENTPPETAITAGPKDKTKKKTATFEFSGADARVLAGFECSLDGAAFAACTSPHTVEVKRGKHTFSVRATDAAGNVDGAPATDEWKVKRKKKRK